MQTFDTQKVMANVVGNIVTKGFYSYIHNYQKQMCSNFSQIKSKFAHRNNKSSKTAKSSSSLVNLADSSKLKQAAKNKIKEIDKRNLDDCYYPSTDANGFRSIFV